MSILRPSAASFYDRVWRLAFGVWRLAFGVWRSAFGVWRSAFGVRRSFERIEPLFTTVFYNVIDIA
jgi:hypothetical protein